MTEGNRRKTIKEINYMRFRWHELLLRDVVLRRSYNALALGGYIMHRFDVRRGYAEFSFAQVAKELEMPRTSVIRARNRLVERAWIKIAEKPTAPTLDWKATRYTFAGGPDDLNIEDGASGADDTEGEVS